MRPIIIGGGSDMVMVMVLAAGHGTRLRPLTDRLPKALVPVGDRPMLAHLLGGVRARLGDVRLFINAHHRAQLIRDYIRASQPGVEVFEESSLLGTAGGIRAAWSAFGGEPVLIVNADILSEPDYAQLLEVARGASCCLCLARRGKGRGSVGVSAEGRVVRLRGEVFGLEVVGGDYMGVAVLGAQAGESLPTTGCLVGDWLLPKLRRGERVHAHFDATQWSDIGELRTYADANWHWLARQGLHAWVATGAKVSANARLASVIVGGGATLQAAGAFERVIVWPGARLNEVVNDCVVMDDGQIVPLTP